MTTTALSVTNFSAVVSYSHGYHSLTSTTTTIRRFHPRHIIHASRNFFFTSPEAQKVNKSIVMNPKGISHTLLPGNMALKTDKKGKTRIVNNIALGSFWMVKDLRDTDNKPILSNEALIPVRDAEMLPSLKGLKSLSGTEVNIPDYFIKTDGTSESSCTLLAISFKDFGYKMLSKWTTPFAEAVVCQKHQQQASVVNIYISQGFFLKLLSGLFTANAKKNTPPDRHESTFMYFGNDVQQLFCDVLRMHNTLTGYVLLLDGLGRLRWIGSGLPTEKELEVLIQCAKDLINSSSRSSSRLRSGSRNVGKKIRMKKTRASRTKARE